MVQEQFMSLRFGIHRLLQEWQKRLAFADRLPDVDFPIQQQAGAQMTIGSEA